MIHSIDFVHYFFLIIFSIETVGILFSQSTRTNWIVFLLLTGMLYAIIGWCLNQHQLNKLKQVNEEVKLENTKKEL
ncbi:hypothetical protein ENUP19_0059G0026 [Entamoeba nuttalli]|uniref:Uncharacterized protein n=1 Tax=Entamoeba nuttalli TaxID=412467 RepID=A0ABQ0DD89_9EUKA